MPELNFIGKEFVYNHHLTVPYRPLVVHANKGIGEGSLDDNLIIHGDNLHALKALLPRYAGKVDCIFIDPPYNTGNEGWSYNDNVNSPLLKEWLSGNPINSEDMLRHDKWCCMIWPRLRLLWELLADYGTIWITIDDGEVHRLKGLLDEIFGTENFVACVCWQKKYATANDTVDFSDMHDFVLVYVKGRPDSSNKKERAVLGRLERTEAQNSLYKNPDNDPRGPWMSDNYTCNKSADERPNLYFAVTQPNTGKQIWPDRSRVWRTTPEGHKRNEEENRIWWGADGKNETPRLKRFLSDVGRVVARTWWPHEFAGHTDEAKKHLNEIFQDAEARFATPKPVRLIERILELATNGNPDALILDSFAGSGTTGHVVSKMNERDGGNRRFILVECEDYADTLTAERLRRVITGYPYKGKQKEALYEKKLNIANLKKADQLLQEATNTATVHEGSYDKVETKLEDGMLRVTGIRKVEETAPGLGGTFTYCTLGEPIDLDKILQGEAMPSYENMAAWLVHTAFGTTLPTSADHRGDGIDEWYVGETASYHVWLIYRPDKAFLQSKKSALTLETAESMSKSKPGKPSLVFASSKYVGKKYLDALTPQVEYAPLPFALYRLERA